ncbi:RND transporter [Rhodomicrobium udaipurense JA643]|uniref:MMPL family transporter n=1 Tax=Rhodomicrobium udaipurense TaxID=1202716 RepID=A0A8I1GGH1_9HYPH|nr:MMPL family transporter [Rhodomicrobium udaipurense]KAI94540.1 RND transporter [Rhodomicrobium udaipurense JA643]MBJ7544394.1 MMPL family transporter [Rhodomicrobium udaipurense]
MDGTDGKQRPASPEAKSPAPLPPAKPDNLVLGLERSGLIALRTPILAAILVALISIVAAFGVARLQVDDSLSSLFRSDTPEFRQFEDLTKRFPSHEFDVLMVVEGDRLLQRGPIDQLRDLVTDVQLIEGTRGILSLFSAREAPEEGKLPGPLFPADLPEGEEYDALIKRVLANDIIKGKFISDDGKLALIVIAIDPAVANGERISEVVKQIRETAAQDLEGSGLRAELSGVPVMRLEIRTAVERDQLLYNGIGFLAGCLIAIIFFRRLSFMVIAAAPPLLAILFAQGALGWMGFTLNTFLNVMTPLIMVISFSDSMQLTFAARDRLIRGDNKYQAFKNAILIVGPACVLTHATAALSFVALLFSSSDMIRHFGEGGIIATVIALFTVITVLPVLGVLLVRKETAFAANMKGADTAVDALRAFCGWIAHRVVARPGVYSAIAVLVVVGLASIYVGLETRYRLADQVPDKRQAVAASQRLDAKLTGSNPINVLIELPKGVSAYDPQALKVLADVHAAVEHQKGVGNVWSVETLRRWIAEKLGRSDIETLQRYVGYLPPPLVQRFLAKDGGAVVVSGYIPDEDANELLPLVNQLDATLNAVREANPGYTVAVTGLSAVAARNSALMIQRLNTALTIEIVFVAAFIGLAFRSFVVMLSAILPAIIPILASGVLLWLVGSGLQFASIVALTVSFGLGLSATIHFLNRLRREDRPGQPPELAVERATVLVGPALILTTVVLACGLAVTVFSDLPSLRLFGWLSAFAMIAALVADLFVLRPIIMFLLRLTRRNAVGAETKAEPAQ